MKIFDKVLWVGIVFAALISLSAMYLARMPLMRSLSVSPVVLGMLCGMVFSVLFPGELPESWLRGVSFCSGRLLRLGIILYGFRVTLEGLFSLGRPGLLTALAVVLGIMLIGSLAGRYLFKLDIHSALLIATGCSICGSAAVMAAEPVIRAQRFKSVTAVSVAAVFGTIGMFLYPAVFRMGVSQLSEAQMGLFIGGTVHGVGHVVGAGEAVSVEASKSAIMVKMLRVILLSPTLIILSVLPIKPDGAEADKADKEHKGNKGKRRIAVPWFAFIFLLVIVLNSLVQVPPEILSVLRGWTTFFLTVAMTSLGLQTDFRRFVKSSGAAFSLGLFLFLILVLGGYGLVRGLG